MSRSNRERTTLVCNMNQDVVTFKPSWSGLDILRTTLEESVNQAAYQLQQNLGGGLKLDSPGVKFWSEVGGSARW